MASSSARPVPVQSRNCTMLSCFSTIAQVTDALRDPGLRSFFRALAQRRHVEHRFRQQLFQLPVLVLVALQTTGVGNLHPAIAESPIVEGRVADLVLLARSEERRGGKACVSTVRFEGS